MRSFTVDLTIFKQEKAAAVVPATIVEVAGSNATIARSVSTLLAKCLMKHLGMSAQDEMIDNISVGCTFKSALTTWCSSFQVDARYFFFGVCLTLSFVYML